MSGRRSAFKQEDATRALKAAVAAGLNPTGFKVGPDGVIHVTFGDAAGAALRNPLDRVLGQ